MEMVALVAIITIVRLDAPDGTYWPMAPTMRYGIAKDTINTLRQVACGIMARG